MFYRHCSIASLAIVLLLSGSSFPATLANRVTILYDAFGTSPRMKKDWGYSALIEYGGKRILFDTGNNSEIFAQNVTVSGVDLTKLDLVVISHRHLDHTAGLAHLLRVNPGVRIYAPKGGVRGVRQHVAQQILPKAGLIARGDAVLRRPPRGYADIRYGMAGG